MNLKIQHRGLGLTATSVDMMGFIRMYWHCAWGDSKSNTNECTTSVSVTIDNAPPMRPKKPLLGGGTEGNKILPLELLELISLLELLALLALLALLKLLGPTVAS